MTHRFYRFVSVAVVVLAAMGLTLAAAQVSGQTKPLVNADANGVGLHGYDPVAYFTDGKAVKGDPQYHSKYDEATHYFRSGDDKAASDKEPQRFDLIRRLLCDGDGQARGQRSQLLSRLRGKLFLQRNEKAHMMFSNDPEGNRKKADENWSKLQSQQDD